LRLQDLKRTKQIYHDLHHSQGILIQSLVRAGGISTFLLLIIFLYLGYGRMQKNKAKLLRGKQLVTPAILKRMIFKSKKASDLTLDDLPLIAGMETSHMLITGTTGSGKTNCFYTLMPQIKRRGDRAIVIDTTGDMVAKFYDPGRDKILNPLDKRSEEWDIFNECQTTTELQTFGSSVISSSNQGDTFWDDGARTIFTTAIETFKRKGKSSIEDLTELLLRSDFKKYSDYFKGTEAATYTAKEGERTTISLRSHMNTKLTWMKYFKDSKESFSIRKWVEDETPGEWLFISCQKKDLVSLRPIMSAWFDVAINSLMNTAPNPKRRLWFILDEIAALQKLPSLGTGLAEIRKNGGCFLVGTQSIQQLQSLYGRDRASGYLDLFNTRVFFRSNDHETLQWISKTIGESQIEETNESLSYGANTIRDGVSLNSVKKIDPIVMPIEISTLENLSCFLKLPENFPITKLKMTYKNLPKTQPAFDINEDILRIKKDLVGIESKKNEFRNDSKEVSHPLTRHKESQLLG